MEQHGQLTQLLIDTLAAPPRDGGGGLHTRFALSKLALALCEASADFSSALILARGSLAALATLLRASAARACQPQCHAGHKAQAGNEQAGNEPAFGLAYCGAQLLVRCVQVEDRCLLAAFLTPGLMAGLARFRRVLKQAVTPQLKRLARDCAAVIHAAQSAWDAVPKASKMRLGVDSFRTPEALAHAPDALQDAWCLALELLRPGSRPDDLEPQAHLSSHDACTHAAGLALNHPAERVTERSVGRANGLGRSRPPPVVGAVVSGPEEFAEEDHGASTDSGDSEWYSASVASMSSTTPPLPRLAARADPAASVAVKGRAHRAAADKTRVTLPVIKNAKRGDEVAHVRTHTKKKKRTARGDG